MNEFGRFETDAAFPDCLARCTSMKASCWEPALCLVSGISYSLWFVFSMLLHINTKSKIIVNTSTQHDVLFLTHKPDQVLALPCPTYTLSARHQKLFEQARLNHRELPEGLQSINDCPESSETSLRAQSWCLQCAHPSNFWTWLY